MLAQVSLLCDNLAMRYQIETTEIFDRWLMRLKDKKTISRILARIYRFEQGNMGDHKNIATNLFEARLFFGPGYRIYYTIRDDVIMLLLCGSDKSSQSRDIEKARQLLEE